MNQYLSAMRVDEFKYIITAELEDAFFKSGTIGGFSGAVVTDTGGMVAVNLYTNPQEDEGIGVRHIPAVGPAVLTTATYMKELAKYPPQFKSGFISNNPPLYNVVPTLKQAIKMWWKGEKKDGG
jgi:arylsulfatase